MSIYNPITQSKITLVQDDIDAFLLEVIGAILYDIQFKSFANTIKIFKFLWTSVVEKHRVQTVLLNLAHNISLENEESIQKLTYLTNMSEKMIYLLNIVITKKTVKKEFIIRELNDVFTSIHDVHKFLNVFYIVCTQIPEIGNVDRVCKIIEYLKKNTMKIYSR